MIGNHTHITVFGAVIIKISLLFHLMLLHHSCVGIMLIGLMGRI